MPRSAQGATSSRERALHESLTHLATDHQTRHFTPSPSRFAPTLQPGPSTLPWPCSPHPHPHPYPPARPPHPHPCRSIQLTSYLIFLDHCGIIDPKSAFCKPKDVDQLFVQVRRDAQPARTVSGERQPH
eukprot:4299856-Prymnesium_polylepis.1